jgi:hypothetical protein
MPLLDHFNPPLNRTHPWRSFHGAWAAAMARLLNQGVLPPGYYAVPLVDRDGPIEIDVATLHEQEAPVPADGAASPQTWAPPAPGLAVAVELPTVDGVEVQVFADDGDPRLAAAIELLSPRNKDRPQARQAFAIQCAGYLQQGSSVVVVDTVTTRRADLNAAILSLLGVEVSAAKPAASPPCLTEPSIAKRKRSNFSSGRRRSLWGSRCRRSPCGSPLISRCLSISMPATRQRAWTFASVKRGDSAAGLQGAAQVTAVAVS